MNEAPSDAKNAVASASSTCERSLTATLCPCSASARQIHAPIPSDPPVTTVTCNEGRAMRGLPHSVERNRREISGRTGDTVWLSIDQDKARLFDAATEKRLMV